MTFANRCHVRAAMQFCDSANSEQIGLASAPHPLGPYTRLGPAGQNIVEHRAEDPFIYKGRLGYHIIAHDMTAGRIDSESGLHMFSRYLASDGSGWLTSPRLHSSGVPGSGSDRQGRPRPSMTPHDGSYCRILPPAGLYNYAWVGNVTAQACASQCAIHQCACYDWIPKVAHPGFSLCRVVRGRLDVLEQLCASGLVLFCSVPSWSAHFFLTRWIDAGCSQVSRVDAFALGVSTTGETAYCADGQAGCNAPPAPPPVSHALSAYTTTVNFTDGAYHPHSLIMFHRVSSLDLL
jgi:hypothetical protein